MKNLNFKFYSVLKNEDAVPYAGDDLLAVADGLGGSGSSVHRIDRSKHQDVRGDTIHSAFGDFLQVSPELLQYLDELIAPMTDGKDDTSALWASRIVIGRCVYALTEGGFRGARLDDGKVRADLAAFIAEGLRGTAEAFDLQKGKYDDQLLLPTTLAFIRFAEEESSVIAETVWAGDSRCYALTPSGLKLLSDDDEDGSGAITNLFHVGDREARPNYLRHEIRKPCILMAVSDGVFDPFDPHGHLGVEHALLSAMAESDSQQELSEKLCRFYDGVHADDATMAFASFGFSDFSDVKRAFRERTETIGSVRRRQAEMDAALGVINLSEEEATHYVASRTADRYDRIVSALTDVVERGADDVAVTAQFRSIAEAVRASRQIAARESDRERLSRASSRLNAYVVSHPECARPETETGFGPVFNGSMQERAFTEFKKAAETLASRKRRYAETASRREELERNKEELHRAVQKKIDLHRKDFDDLWDDRTQGSRARRKEEARILCGWYGIDNALKSERRLQEQEISDRLPPAEREWAYTVKEYLDERCEWQKDLEFNKKACDAAERRYAEAWNRLYAQLKRDGAFARKLLTREAIVRFGFGETDAAAPSAGRMDGDGLAREFREQKTAVVSGIVRALAIGYDKTSVIDAQYNATKLEAFRIYYRLRNDPNDEIKKFEKELLALESEYTRLVDHAKF